MRWATAFRELVPRAAPGFGGSSEEIDGWSPEGGSFPQVVEHGLQIAGTAVDPIVYWDVPGSLGGVEVLARVVYTGDSTDDVPLVVVHGQPGAAGGSYYWAGFDFAVGRFRTGSRVLGAMTVEGDVAAAVERGGVYWVRLRATSEAGTWRLEARWWAHGAAEPAAAQVSNLAGDVVGAGRVGLASLDQTAVVTMCSHFGVSDLAGGGAPGASFLGLPAEELGDGSIEYTLEVEGWDPAAGAVVTRYYSTHGRVLDAGDSPPSVAMPAALVPGKQGPAVGLEETLSEGALFVGLRDSRLQAGLDGAQDAVGELANLTLRGRRMVLRAGDAAAQSHRGFRALAAGLVADEASGLGVDEVRIAGAGPSLALGDRRLDQRVYVGEPGAVRYLTNTGRALAPDNAAHHLTEFTLAGRFRVAAPTGNAQRFSARETSSTAMNWRVSMLSSLGFVRAIYSSGGVANAVFLTSTAEYDDDLDHVWFFARSSTHAYLMVDGEVVAERSNPPPPDSTMTTGVVQGVNFPGLRQTDHRILDHYIAPDAAAAWMAVLASGEEEGLVGLYRADEPSGATLTDYSPTGADATISGTAGVDWERLSSDLGEPESAGQLMPVVAGRVVNAPLVLTHAGRQRYRSSDRALGFYTGIQEVRSRAVPLSGAAWTASAGVVDFASVPQDEPMTIETVDGTGAFTATLERVLGSLLADRAGIDEMVVRKAVPPWIVGLSTRERLTAAALLERMVSTLGVSYGDDPWGRLALDLLRPPVGEGPFGWVPHLEGQEVVFAPGVGRITSTLGTATPMAITGWFRTPSVLQRDFVAARGTWNDSDTGLPAGDGYFLWFDATGRMHFTTPAVTGGSSGGDTTTAPGLLEPDTWYAVVGSLSSSGARSLKVAKLGDANWRSSTSNSSQAGSIGAATVPLRVRSHPTLYGHVYNRALTTGEQLEVLTAPAIASTTERLVYAPGTDGAGGLWANDGGAGSAGIVLGSARWTPRLDLDVTAMGLSWEGVKRMRPAELVEVIYRQNAVPITDADIAGSATAAERLAAKRPAKRHPGRSKEAADFLGAREISLTTGLYHDADAAALLDMVMARFGVDRWSTGVEVGQRQLAVRLGEELWLRDDETAPDRRAWRVISRAIAKGDLGLWG